MNAWIWFMLVLAALFVLLLVLEERRRRGGRDLHRPISYKARTGLPWGDE